MHKSHRPLVKLLRNAGLGIRHHSGKSRHPPALSPGFRVRDGMAVGEDFGSLRKNTNGARVVYRAPYNLGEPWWVFVD